MKTAEFDYELPDDLIARHPPAERDGGRLLVVEERLRHSSIRALPEELRAGDLLVLNDSRVLKARLLGRRSGGGGRVELLLLQRVESRAAGAVELWTALGKASKPLRPGARLEFDGLGAEVIESSEGTLRVRLTAEGSVDDAVERVGVVPLPPYLGRAAEAADEQRYQTVFARELGSVAAPTAGLHLTPTLLAAARERGVATATVTLHVGLGTFRPVSVEDLDQHPMHAEHVEVTPELVAQVERTRAQQGRIVAVGTTVVRSLESAAATGTLAPMCGETRLLIQPGYRFVVVDALLTNFHQPRSTLLALVSAFMGRDRCRAAYECAVRERYRFLSYGDAMFIPQRSLPCP